MSLINPKLPGYVLAAPTATVFALTAYALPLIVLPSLIADPVDEPKLAILALSTAALVGIGLSRFFLFGQGLCPRNRVLVPLLCILFWAIIAAFESPAPLISARSLLYLGALASATFMIGSLANPERFLNALMIASSLVALYGVGQFMGFEPFPWSSHFKPRIFSSMGNPVFLGGFLAAVFPLAFARWLYCRREETKDLLTLLLSILGAAVYLTWTRSSWFALGISTSIQISLLAARPAGRRRLAENRAWLLTITLIGILGVTLVSSSSIFGNAPVPLLERLRDSFDLKGYSVRFRMVTSEAALRITATKPLTGAGLASFQSLYPDIRLATKAARNDDDFFFVSQEAFVHNEHVQILAELGLVGFGLWIWLLACAIRVALLRQKAEDDWIGLGVLGTIIAVCTDACFNFPLHIVPTAWVFFCAAGLLACRPREIAPPPGGSWRYWVAGMLVACCVLIVLKIILAGLRAQHNQLIGDRYIAGKNFEMAMTYYTRALADDPLNRFLVFRSSVALMHTSRFEWDGRILDNSLRLAKRAQALGYKDENIYKHLSDIFGRKTAIPKAAAALTKSYALNPKREDVANNLAYYLAESGTRLAEAARLAEMAVEQSGGEPSFLDTLGWVQYRSGRLKEAEATLRRALRGIPADANKGPQLAARAEIRAHLAEVLRAKGR